MKIYRNRAIRAYLQDTDVNLAKRGLSSFKIYEKNLRENSNAILQSKHTYAPNVSPPFPHFTCICTNQKVSHASRIQTKMKNLLNLIEWVTITHTQKYLLNKYKCVHRNHLRNKHNPTSLLNLAYYSLKFISSSYIISSQNNTVQACQVCLFTHGCQNSYRRKIRSFS